MGEKKLTVFNANIRAAAVSIKMLTLDAKKAWAEYRDSLDYGIKPPTPVPGSLPPPKS